jgi:hypothetical protein
VSWAAQCRSKVALAQDVLSLLTGRRPGSSGTPAPAAPSAAAGDGASAATELAACCGAAAELAKECDAFARGALEEWQAATAAWLGRVAGWQGAPLMSFHAASRRVSAHFTKSLVVLLREARGFGKGAAWLR